MITKEDLGARIRVVRKQRGLTLKELESMRLSSVAMVGTPCQIRTIRKMQCLGVSPAHAIGYALGLFCMGRT